MCSSVFLSGFLPKGTLTLGGDVFSFASGREEGGGEEAEAGGWASSPAERGRNAVLVMNQRLSRSSSSQVQSQTS